MGPGDGSIAREAFGPEGAAHVRSELEASAKPLARLLGRLDIEAGKVWAFVPADSPPGLRRDFEGGSFSDYEFPWAPAVAKWLDSRLTAMPGGVVLFEDPSAEPGDPFLERRREIPLLFGDDAVYRHALPGASRAELELLLTTALWYPTVGVVGGVPAGMRMADRQSVTTRQLGAIAEDPTAIIVGAWDAEAVLIWERDSAA